MTATDEQISRLLHEPGETHHRVFRIVDADDDWASWYSDWLINLSELPSLLGTKPVRSELTGVPNTSQAAHIPPQQLLYVRLTPIWTHSHDPIRAGPLPRSAW
jgi:hypothetical protein